MANFKKIREKMWLKNPHCENCGVETVLPDQLKDIKKTKNGGFIIKSSPDNMATIQHIYNRLNPLRKELNNVKKRALFCYKCNNEENELRQKELSIEKKRELSGRGNVS